MIRRDYILRMIEEFIRALARVHTLKQGRQWPEAAKAVDAEMERLIGLAALEAAQLTETDLLARLLRGEPTQAMADKTLIVAALLKEAGEIAAAQGRLEEGRACFLKALHLLLERSEPEEAFEYPPYVPTIDALRNVFGDAPLPAPTLVLLMRHFERTGQFAQAEDALFELLESAPGDAAVVELGVAFYRRALNRGDGELSAGNLPRAEVEAGLAELLGRRHRS